MKKTTIWIIAIIMGFSFLGLLYLQLSYIEAMARMKKEQFDEGVNRSLYQASRNLEMNETLHYLEKDINERERKNMRRDTASNNNNSGFTSFQMKMLTLKPSSVPKAILLRSDKNSVNEASRSLQDVVRNRYVYQKALLDEVIYNILYTANEKSLKERINFKLLDQDLRAELLNNGISIPYHFVVETSDGREIYRCPDYTDEGKEYTYTQILFRNDPPTRMGVVKIHFPDTSSYIFSNVKFMIPAVFFTGALLVTFIFTIVIIFRQKRYSEMKNDFVNNMTHELKTPIASISLAAQMLNDKSIPKSEATMTHLGSVVADETKRLRFLVEKVLQMSMFDRKDAVFKKKELDLNEMVENIANSFTLRVEHTGGKIYTSVEAIESKIYVDEIHFQNVIFNLLDNAVKYRNIDTPLYIYIRTWDDEKRLYLSIRDTGMGIKKENLKKVFDKFYRVHTGNRHDAKGFGLGLAYVRKMVQLHKGQINVDSEYGKGTTFTISLPVMK